MRLELMHISDMAERPLSEELVPGLLDTGLVIAIAEPAAGKTFLGIHVGVHVAAGLKWRGRAVTQGPVVYCIAEGVSFFTYRITTAFDQLGVRAKDHPFYVLPHSLNMRSGDDGQVTPEIGALCEAIGGLPEKPRLIVFDTLNRFMPGGDENKQADASALVRGCEYLQQNFGGTVMMMHHLRKGGDVARGSTVFTGAADQVIFAKKGKGGLTDTPVLWTTEGAGKRKDRDPVKQWFQFKSVAMSKGNLADKTDEDDWDDFYVMRTDYDEDGNEVRTNVVEDTLVMEPCEPPADEEEEGKESTDDMEALVGLMLKDDGGIRVRRSLDLLGWKSMSRFYRTMEKLVAAGKARQNEDKSYSAVRTGNPFKQGG